MPDDLLDGEQGKVTVADLVEKAEEEKESEVVAGSEQENNGVAGEIEEEEVAPPVESEAAPLTQVTIKFTSSHTNTFILLLFFRILRPRSPSL